MWPPQVPLPRDPHHTRLTRWRVADFAMGAVCFLFWPLAALEAMSSMDHGDAASQVFTAFDFLALSFAATGFFQHRVSRARACFIASLVLFLVGAAVSLKMVWNR